MPTKGSNTRGLLLFSLLSAVLILSSLAAPAMVAAGSAVSATSSFKNPSGCKAAHALAQAVNAVQACQQRFSPTHEFAIILIEKRYRVSANSSASARKAVSGSVRKYLSDLKRANQNVPGQELQYFETIEWSDTNEKMPKGAEYCQWGIAVVLDGRVPGHVGEPFNIWIETRVCARFDPSTKTVQLVELRASERAHIRKDTALAERRREASIPSRTARKAAETLALF